MVIIRGSEVAECRKLLDFIVGEVKSVSLGGMKVEWEERIRSPHFSGGVEIDLEKAVSEAGLGDDDGDGKKRTLECPETRLSIRAEQLLMRAGLTDSWLSRTDSSSSWWNFHAASNGSLLVPVYYKSTSSSSSDPVKH